MTRIDDVSRVKTIVASAEQAVTAAGGDAAYDMFYDEASDTPYETYDPDDPVSGKHILVLEADGKLIEFDKVSPMTKALNSELMFRRIHVTEEYRDVVARGLN